jgi:hypothetical protein
MGTSVGNSRFGTIFFTIFSEGELFEVADARVEISRGVNAQGRRTGSSLAIRVHIVIDLISVSGQGIAGKLFNISTQADDVVQLFKVTWFNPITSSDDAKLVRELTFSGWCSGYELYRPELTGSSAFGAGEASDNTQLGRADQLLHCTFAVVTDDENIGQLSLTE